MANILRSLLNQNPPSPLPSAAATTTMAKEIAAAASNQDFETMSKYIRYDVIHILRCHSKENNPHDNSTRVEDVAFELDEHCQRTNVFASCAQNIVNIIDAVTGKVAQRFNDELTIRGTKDIFKRILWSRINNASIITVAGLHGQIKLISPKCSMCILRIDASNTQIDSIVYHPKFPNILLCK